jgi:hypothetical protein
MSMRPGAEAPGFFLAAALALQEDAAIFSCAVRTFQAASRE